METIPFMHTVPTLTFTATNIVPVPRNLTNSSSRATEYAQLVQSLVLLRYRYTQGGRTEVEEVTLTPEHAREHHTALQQQQEVASGLVPAVHGAPHAAVSTL